MMQNSGILFDVTKCVGCGSCTVGCKLWNDLEYDNGNAHGYNVKLAQETWTTIQYHDATTSDNESVLRFAKHQCMHCLDPSCVAVCFAKAIVVDESGAVVYDPKKCVGCRYCMIGCPYDVPKYEWDKVFPSIMKCQLCVDKISNNEMPACASVCPTGAMIFGDRDELLAQAHKIIAGDKKYINEVYGEKQGGGTRWLYISDVPFESLGFPTNVPTKSIPSTLHDYSKWKPGIFAGGLVIFGALGLYTKRRLRVEEEKKKEEGGNEDV